MTGNSDESDRFSHPSAEAVGTHTPLHSQQRNTPRALRFSQKLMNAAKKSPLARYPLATPTTSASLSPSLEPYDDESMTDNFSLSPHYDRDDPELNCHLQDLMLSPLRPTAESPLAGGSSWLLDKRPQVHHRGSDSPSLSAKPKRRKLKQQRATAWRTGADATLDTNKIYAPLPEKEHQQSQYNFRRSTRIADTRQETLTRRPRKPLPVILGTPTGVKHTDTILLHDEDDDNDDLEQRLARRRRPKVDFVEERLDKLLTAHDPLDLSHHSVIPKNHQGAPAPVVIVLDDEEQDKVKAEPIDDIHLSSLPTHLDLIDDDDDMINVEAHTSRSSMPTIVTQQHIIDKTTDESSSQQQQSTNTSHLDESPIKPTIQITDDDEMVDGAQQQRSTNTSHLEECTPTIPQEISADDEMADRSQQQQSISISHVEESPITPTTQQEISADDEMADGSQRSTSTSHLEESTSTPTTQQEISTDDVMTDGSQQQRSTSTSHPKGSPSTPTTQQEISTDDVMTDGSQQQRSTSISHLKGSPSTPTTQQEISADDVMTDGSQPITTSISHTDESPTATTQQIDDDKMADKSSQQATSHPEESPITPTIQQEISADDGMADDLLHQQQQQSITTSISHIEEPPTITTQQIDDDNMADESSQQAASTSHLQTTSIPPDPTPKKNDNSIDKAIDSNGSKSLKVPSPPLDSSSTTNEPPPPVETQGTRLLTRLFGPVAHYLIR